MVFIDIVVYVYINANFCKIFLYKSKINCIYIFLVIIILKLIGDSVIYNVFPENYMINNASLRYAISYSSPLYRCLDYLIGFVSCILLKDISFDSKIRTSFFQISMFFIYFIVCIRLNKLLLPGIFILLALLLIVTINMKNGIMDKILGNKIIVKLGNIGLELYLLHFVVYVGHFILWNKILIFLEYKIPIIFNGAVRFVLVLLFTIILSIIYRKYFNEFRKEKNE